MRNPIAVVTSLLLAACGGATAASPPPAPSAPAAETKPTTEQGEVTAAPAPTALSPAEAQHKALADYAVAFDSHDAQKAARFFTDRAVIKLAGAPDVVGHDAIVATIASNHGISADAKTPFTRLFSHGNVVVGEWIWAGTHTGDLMGLPPTNRPFGLNGVSIYFFTPEAKLEAAHVYFDMGTLMSQLGASKQPARPVQALPTEPALKIASTNAGNEPRNLGLATSLMGAFEKKSEANFLASMSDTTRWDVLREPATVQGTKAAKTHFKSLLKAFPDAKVTIDNSWAVGDFVIVEGTLSGTHKGALGPIAATKKPVNLHFADIMEFDSAGKIVKGWSYGNSAELAMQLGLLPPPAGAPKPSNKQ